MGKGREVRQHQGRVIRATPAKYSVTPVPRNTDRVDDRLEHQRLPVLCVRSASPLSPDIGAARWYVASVPGHEQVQQDAPEKARPTYSMTSSARASSCDGTSRPSALAVFMLITNSYLVGACTGSSAGFSPFRMRSTYPAAPRYCSS